MVLYVILNEAAKRSPIKRSTDSHLDWINPTKHLKQQAERNFWLRGVVYEGITIPHLNYSLKKELMISITSFKSSLEHHHVDLVNHDAI